MEAEKNVENTLAARHEMYEILRENNALRMEEEYRRRLSEVTNEVKKRLDYQVCCAVVCVFGGRFGVHVGTLCFLVLGVNRCFWGHLALYACTSCVYVLLSLIDDFKVHTTPNTKSTIQI